MHFRGYADVGLYGAAAKVSLIMSFLVQAFTLAWGPFGFAQAQADAARPLFARVLGLYVWAAAVIAVFLSVFAREVLGVGTTRAYVQGQAVAPFLIFSVLLHGTYPIFSVGIAMVRRRRFGLEDPPAPADLVAAVRDLARPLRAPDDRRPSIVKPAPVPVSWPA